MKSLVQNFQFMNNTGKHITEKQNEDFHIDELLAQQRIYSNAKNFQGLLIFITVPLPVLIAIIIKISPELIDQTTWIFALYLIFASLGEKILDSTIGRLKKIAASIQESFDLTILNIESNETLNLAMIDKETIRHYSKKPKQDIKKIEEVTNWYSINIIGLPTNIASMLCQRTNIYYDFSVRKRYNFLMTIFATFTFITLLIISLINALDLKSFLVEVVLPSIPIFVFAYKEKNTNIESIDNLKHLKKLIESSLSNLNINDEIEDGILRKIQDRIYANRLLSPLIPDLIYKIVRPKLEDEMNYSVEERIKILRSMQRN